MSEIVPQIKLSENGPSMSRIIYGTWHMTGVDQSSEHILSRPENILSRIKACLSAGITTFDLSDLYGFYQFEALFGEALDLEPEIKDKIQM
jgi:predicted oxidoreductase